MGKARTSVVFSVFIFLLGSHAANLAQEPGVPAIAAKLAKSPGDAALWAQLGGHRSIGEALAAATTLAKGRGASGIAWGVVWRLANRAGDPVLARTAEEEALRNGEEHDELEALESGELLLAVKLEQDGHLHAAAEALRRGLAYRRKIGGGSVSLAENSGRIEARIATRRGGESEDGRKARLTARAAGRWTEEHLRLLDAIEFFERRGQFLEARAVCTRLLEIDREHPERKVQNLEDLVLASRIDLVCAVRDSEQKSDELVPRAREQLEAALQAYEEESLGSAQDRALAHWTRGLLEASFGDSAEAEAAFATAQKFARSAAASRSLESEEIARILAGSDCQLEIDRAQNLANPRSGKRSDPAQALRVAEESWLWSLGRLQGLNAPAPDPSRRPGWQLFGGASLPPRRSGTAIATFLVGSHATSVILIQESGVIALPLGETHLLREKVLEFARTVSDEGSNERTLERVGIDAAKALFSDAWQKIAQADHLVIAGTQGLPSLPWAALVRPGPEPIGRRFLGAKTEIVVSPAISILRELASPKQGSPLLVSPGGSAQIPGPLANLYQVASSTQDPGAVTLSGRLRSTFKGVLLDGASADVESFAKHLRSNSHVLLLAPTANARHSPELDALVLAPRKEAAGLLTLQGLLRQDLEGRTIAFLGPCSRDRVDVLDSAAWARVVLADGGNGAIQRALPGRRPPSEGFLVSMGDLLAEGRTASQALAESVRDLLSKNAFVHPSEWALHVAYSSIWPGAPQASKVSGRVLGH